MSVFEKIYDCVRAHRTFGMVLLTMFVALCVVLTLRLDYKEEITDFLPVDDHYRESMRIYQEVASANKVVIQFEAKPSLVGSMPESAIADSIISAVTEFGEILQSRDSLGWVLDYEPQVDASQILDVAEFVYSHLPYMLEAEDYRMIDSLLQQPDFVSNRMNWILQQIEGMAGSFMAPMLQYDPLGLGNRIASHLKDFQPQVDFMKYDGYVFTPDGMCCLVTIESPFGSSESRMNGQLVELLESVADDLHSDFVNVSLTGAPVIAAGNASRIQHDTILSVAVSVIAILLLLLWAFRSLRSLWYIVLSTGFGFLFALATLSLLGVQVSMIVIGIASIIIGIAVNYPLHFVCHNQEVLNGRQTLSDLVKPLLVGNITTVAAFLTLVPLEAIAVRQLGVFSAFMLVGTILFVMLVLPHIISSKGNGSTQQKQEPEADFDATEAHSNKLLTRISNVLSRLITHPLSLVVVFLLTLFFGWFSFQTVFDTDITHLNYMTAQQRSDMQRLSHMQGQSEGIVVYLPASIAETEAMRSDIDSLKAAGIILDEKNPTWFIASSETQTRRLAMWREFWTTHNYLDILSESRRHGFSEEAFEPFQLLIETNHDILSYSDYEPLTTSILTGYSNSEAMVSRLTVADSESASEVEKILPGAFDMKSLNAQIADTLTADFNYIGFACALIVFVFLWFSFGRFEIALLAFMPMAVGWLWILGIMQLLGIHFNLVNIILATFIFGQGDDYTIFITEGLLRDYRQNSGHRVLVSYQRSILLSAAIMLLGIGSLILAQHPAMHSLAEVTIVGMGVVVFMAWLLPPMLFHWLVRFDRPLRRWLDHNKGNF